MHIPIVIIHYHHHHHHHHPPYPHHPSLACFSRFRLHHRHLHSTEPSSPSIVLPAPFITRQSSTFTIWNTLMCLILSPPKNAYPPSTSHVFLSSSSLAYGCFTSSSFRVSIIWFFFFSSMHTLTVFYAFSVPLFVESYDIKRTQTNSLPHFISRIYGISFNRGRTSRGIFCFVWLLFSFCFCFCFSSYNIMGCYGWLRHSALRNFYEFFFYTISNAYHVFFRRWWSRILDRSLTDTAS